MKGRHLVGLTLVGSRAVGTQREDSDVDIRGVYIAPTTSFLGLKADRQPTSITVPDVDDTVIYEVGHFLQMALAANPNVFEILDRPSLLRSSTWDYVRSLKSCFLSKQIIATHIGFAKSALKNAEKRPEIKAKSLAVARRVVTQGIQLCEQGELSATSVCTEEPVRALIDKLAASGDSLPAKPDVDKVREALVSIRQQH